MAGGNDTAILIASFHIVIQFVFLKYRPDLFSFVMSIVVPLRHTGDLRKWANVTKKLREQGERKKCG
jgi:hypothetical protein